MLVVLSLISNFFIGDSHALALQNFLMVYSHCVTSSFLFEIAKQILQSRLLKPILWVAIWFVVYFDQLSDGARTQKLVETFFFCHFSTFFCSFQSFFSDFTAEINKSFDQHPKACRNTQQWFIKKRRRKKGN